MSATKHGYTKGCAEGERDARYAAWINMMDRCYNPKCQDYNKYGGQGIGVCLRWWGKKGLEKFISDMGERPLGTSLDRKNNWGDYEPKNCRWASPSTQTLNRKRWGKGYYWDKNAQSYKILWVRNQKQYYFGCIKTEQEAQQKAEAARIVLDIFPRIQYLADQISLSTY